MVSGFFHFFRCIFSVKWNHFFSLYIYSVWNGIISFPCIYIQCEMGSFLFHGYIYSVWNGIISFPCIYIQCEMGSFLFHVYIQCEMGSFLFPVYIFSVKWDHFFSLYSQSEMRSFFPLDIQSEMGIMDHSLKNKFKKCLFRLLVPGVPRKILKLTRVWLSVKARDNSQCEWTS